MLTLALPAQEKGVFALTCPLPRRMWKAFSIGESIVHRPWSPQIIVTMPPPVTGHQGFLLLLGSGTALSDRTSVMLEMF